jgi:acyl-CoA reductase-like NAD-dependent aldehyde dehydrogenase
LLLEGQLVDGAAPSTVVRAPWDGAERALVGSASSEQAERALAFAEAGRARLRALSAGARRSVLQAVIAGLERRRSELVEAIVHEAGKPVTAARAEVSRAIETFTLAAAELTRFGGELIPVDLLPGNEGTEGEVRRFPAGVVVGIVPFNFPLNLGAHKIAPALAVGAPIIVKPPPQAPSAMLIVGELVKEASADPAAMQVLPSTNEIAQALAIDARVKVMSFTGSARVGWELMRRCAGRVVLELGGNAAAIVRSDADLDRAAKRLAIGAFTYAGQVCIKVQRIVVEDSAWASFVPRFLEQVDALGVGDPELEATVIGPLIDDAAANRVESWIDEASSLGAVALRRGARRGRLLGPTVLTDVPREAKAFSEEIFGPVVVLERVSTFEAAIESVNQSRYGLQAALFTNDHASIRQAFRALEVGGLIVNDATTFRSDATPYGGVKASGRGREGVRSAMLDFTEERVLITRP